ncbi:DUF4136 domain-containing protein [Hymenobacter lapidiphilus]|uniref:DUF4136 domain-containing protein n=1 Tax=Hymenobacter lapidiphilus TaxID=2608003 RepID=A0A7Y7PPM8_9BACT|nr:DUF4136 domain-containing protein [Hymenobacter lapidiphilus]NVO31690.1 DUF4136 domain-containing protein [Hymenobacter lapidiphilus]
MNFKHLILALGTTLLMAGCNETKQAVTVGADERGGATNIPGYVNNATDGPDFSKYKSYSWASQLQDEQQNTYFLNDLIFKTMLRDAVSNEMASRGYNYMPTGGDLILNFRVFEEPVTLKTMDNMGTGYWGTTESYAYDVNRFGEVQLDKGSIIVQMIDRQKGQEVWQGYASGLTDGNVFNKKKDKVYSAVGAIFQKYEYRGDKL